MTEPDLRIIELENQGLYILSAPFLGEGLNSRAYLVNNELVYRFPKRPEHWEEQFALLFRDYLCAHAEEARRYEALKYQLAAKYREDRHGYTDAKGPFIREIMTKADRWSQE